MIDGKKFEYVIYFWALMLFSSCSESSNPLAPAQPESPDWLAMEWRDSEFPDEIEGNWWLDQKVYIRMLSDGTVRIYADSNLYRYAIRTVEKSETGCYRLILLDKQQIARYRILYISWSDYNSILIQLSDPATLKLETDYNLNLENPLLLSFTPSWTVEPVPEKLQGNWHVGDGIKEVTINGDYFAWDGGKWRIVQFETNSIQSRLIIQDGSRYKAVIIYGGYGQLLSATIPYSFAYSLQDARATAQGDTLHLRRWRHLLDIWPLKRGAAWRYSYYFKNNRWVNPNWTGWSSDLEERKGTFRLEVLEENGGHSFKLQSTYNLEFYTDHYFRTDYERDPNNPGEYHYVTVDTTWTDSNLVYQNVVNMVIERDTLWNVTDSGLVYATPVKVHYGQAFNFNFLAFSGQQDAGYGYGSVLKDGFTLEYGVGIKSIGWEDYYSGNSTGKSQKISYELVEFTPGGG